MLFNTLGYAEFLAIVFGVAWLLVDRRNSLWLPWFALVGLSVHLSGEANAPSSITLGAVTAAAGLLTFALRQKAAKTSSPADAPSARLALVALTLSALAAAFVSFRTAGTDPVSVALGALGVPLNKLGAAHSLGGHLLGTLRYLVPVVGLSAAYFLIASGKVRLLFILGASYVFYAHWDWRFLPLIWASSTADWWLGRTIHRASPGKSKKLWLLATVVMNLGVLGFFKYFNFGIDSATALFAQVGVTVPEVVLRVALPVGISFFTFESMSYVIDVYRGELEPQESYVEYLAFVAFFPHLVAGPIVRPRDLLPQLSGEARFSPTEASEGLFLIAVGLSKKIVIGDYLALNLIDRVFDAPLFYSAAEVYAAVVGYALQIYCDFSGYTDIAIGSALLLGVRFPLNFNSPYKAAGIVDFWRRWHISLSTWLRDYLYIPLGGNRKGPGRTYLNLLITMVLGGLWHGAAWTFVVWGTLHGLALAAEKWFSDLSAARRRKAGTNAPKTKSALSHALAVFFTFQFVCLGWIFFRADSFAQAELIIRQLMTATLHHPNLPPAVLGILALGLTTHFVPDRAFAWIQSRFVTSPAIVQGVLLFLVAILLRRMAAVDAVPFVYFQF